MTTQHFDIVICGGGMIGAGLASLLAPLPLSIAVIEPRPPSTFAIDQAFDLRVSALLPAAKAVLQRTDAWQNILAMRATPLNRMRVWEQEGIGDVNFNAHDIGINHLGHIVENRITQLGLWQALQAFTNVTLISPATPVAMTRKNDRGFITYDNGMDEKNTTISGHLVVAADGGDSFVRQHMGMLVHRYRYQQACLVASVNTQLGQQDITWQRFVPTGPQAFLPLLGQHGSVVWYHHTDEINRLAALPNEQLSAHITQAFPAQLGAIEVTGKAHFPLQKMHALDYVQEGVVLVGDAAHMVNPLAGQGVNLGFKDIACLAHVITHALQDEVHEGQAWWSQAVLKTYEQTRRFDNRLMMEAMDAFYHGFSNQNQGFKWLRNGMLSAARLSFVKQRIMRYALSAEPVNGQSHSINKAFVEQLGNLRQSPTIMTKKMQSWLDRIVK